MQAARLGRLLGRPGPPRLSRGLVLGIETSCDDTGAGLVGRGGEVLGQTLVRQNTVRLGGVIPTFAMIEHAQVVESVVADCLSQAGAEPADLTAVAVSTRPGMKGSLTVGTDYAKYLCLKHRLPLIPVHHMEAHALTARLPGAAHPPSTETAEHSTDSSDTTVQFPFLVLLISGGHCLLALATDIDQFQVGSLVVSGGVASNAAVRTGLDTAAHQLGLATVYPHPSLCTDNGVMVAWNGYERWRAGRGVVPWHQALEVAVQSRCPLGADLHQEVLAASIKCKWLKI